MSHSSLYYVYKDRVELIKEISDVYKTTWPIYEYIYKLKYPKDNINILHMTIPQRNRLNRLIRDKTIDENIRIIFAFTFENALCYIQYIPRLIIACKSSKFIEWVEIGEILSKLEIEPPILGVGFSSSNEEDAWEAYPEIEAFSLEKYINT